MKNLEETTFDKCSWGPGPRQTEPDKKQWLDTDTGLPCLIVRNELGALCGYVGVAEGHPAFEKKYEEINVDVHGGITFTDFCQESGHVCHITESGVNDRVWWVGFDCNHCGDFPPGMPSLVIAYKNFPHPDYEDYQYRDIEYVTREVKNLATQLAALNS